MKRYQLIFVILLLVGCSDLIEDFTQAFDEGFDEGFKNSYTNSFAASIRSKIDFVELNNQIERGDLTDHDKALRSLISSESFYLIENFCSCTADKLIDRYSPKELAKMTTNETNYLNEKDYNDCQISLIKVLPFK